MVTAGIVEDCRRRPRSFMTCPRRSGIVAKDFVLIISIVIIVIIVIIVSVVIIIIISINTIHQQSSSW